MIHCATRAALCLALPLLAACSPSPGPKPATPAPVVTVTTTATVTPTPPSAAVSPSPTSEVYRVRAEFLDASDVVFNVTLNGKAVGSFNADSQNEVTPLIQSGSNQIGVTWSKASTIQDNGKAMLYLESQRPGQENWNTLFSREVARTTKDTSASATFDVGSATTTTTTTGSAPAVSPTPAAPASPAAATELKGRYIIKVENSSLAPAEFSVSINGGPDQVYTANANQDITASVRPGPNTVKLVYKSLNDVPNNAWKSTFTIGLERDGKWATVGNQSVGKDDSEGSRTFSFTAK